MKKNIFLVMFFSLSLVISCAPRSHFGVTDQAIGVPSQFDETEAAVMQAERSPGAKYCPEKIAKAKELGAKGVETYWACRTDEAMKLLAEARKWPKRPKVANHHPLRLLFLHQHHPHHPQCTPTSATCTSLHHPHQRHPAPTTTGTSTKTSWFLIRSISILTKPI